VIITRTPFRVSFVGGGTDLPDFYRLEPPGAVVSTAINKYMYIVVNKRFDGTIRISYSKTEIVKDAEQIQHSIVKEALKLTGITRGIEVVSIADIPAGTGLGSSSSFTVGLLNALYAYKGVLKSAEELAREACHIEIDILGEPIGKQDQYIAAYGGLRYIQFNPDETVFTEPIIYASRSRAELNQNLLLFYSGETREAGSLLREQKANIGQGNKLDLLKRMRDMAVELKNRLNNNSFPNVLGEFLHQGWQLKKQLSTGISNDRIDDYYKKALDAGALGGKILGAGGGGFLLVYCPKENQVKLQRALGDLPLTRIALEPEGSKIIYVI
jgi:D-glycero-alpha-D-manno-heptose-7-phosphate kinase